jgi:hypothetical protein
LNRFAATAGYGTTTSVHTTKKAHSGQKSLKLSNTKAWKYIYFSDLDVTNNLATWKQNYTHIRFYVYTPTAANIENRTWRNSAYNGNALGVISTNGSTWTEVVVSLDNVVNNGLFFNVSTDIYLDDI